MKPKPIIGQQLFSLNVGNSARYRPQKLTPVIVSKVGNKYFSVRNDEYGHDFQFHIHDWHEKSEYSPDLVLYASAQEWQDEKEIATLCKSIAHSFQYGKNTRSLNLKTIRHIWDVIAIETNGKSV